jgi:transcription factor MYB, plant
VITHTHAQVVDDRAQPAGTDGQRDQELLADALQQKGKPSKNIERARARFLKQRREMQSQQLLLQGQAQQQEEEEEKRPDHDDGPEAAPAVSLARQLEEDLRRMLQQDMDDLMFQFCPMASSCLLPRGSGCTSVSASASEEGSSGDHHQLDGSATWDWGSLWNLDDVVDGGAWDSSSPLLQDQGLAFY